MSRSKVLLLTFFLASLTNIAFADWKTSVSCEDNSVRLDRDGHLFQLVIDPTEGNQNAQRGMTSLIERGAINPENIQYGKIILYGEWRGATWNYFSYAPRDNGQIVYQIMVSDSNKTLDIAATWRGHDLSDRIYVPAFTGFKFYGCNYVY